MDEIADHIYRILNFQQKITKKMLAQKPSREVAEHTKDAIQIWRDCASARITLQGALQECHGAGFDEVRSTPDASRLVESLAGVLHASVSRTNSCHDITDIESWQAIERMNSMVMKYCLEIADEWHEKTKGPNRKNLKALDQSISAQMGYVMTDPDNRAIKRCRGVTDEEYDDAPLYAAILKESVQKGASGDEYRAMKMASKFGKKAGSKEVDRRASKGRRIRYTSIEKLVNFMAPRAVPVSEGRPITNEELVNAFVASVFH
jgi:hypothetical protein